MQRAGIPYKKSYTYSASNASYYPGGLPISLKLIFTPDGSRILGAQAVGFSGVDKRIDVIATVMRLGGSVEDLTKLELCYAPPFSSAKDPVNMMMFVLTFASFNLFVFADDKEQGQLRRVATAPVSFGFYLAAHCLFCISLLLPEYLLLVTLKLLGWDIGFSLLQYAGLLAILGLFGISLSLLLHTLIKKPDNANMLCIGCKNAPTVESASALNSATVRLQFEVLPNRSRSCTIMASGSAAV